MIAAVAACSSRAENAPVEVRLAIDPDSCSLSPDVLPLDFAEAGIRVTDASGDQLAGDCLAAEPGSSLSDLPDLLAGVALSDLPADQPLDVELAIYQPAALEPCPPAGDNPLDPAPTYGGRSGPVRLTGSAPSVDLLLTCEGPVSCAPLERTSVSASVAPLGGALPPGALEVRAGFPVAGADRLLFRALGFLVELDPCPTQQCWSAALDGGRATCWPGPPSCFGSVVGANGSPYRYLSCAGSGSGEHVSLFAAWLDPAAVDAVRDNLGISANGGFAIGRVVDDAGNGIAAATIEGVDWSPTVTYLDSDWMAASASEDGYFVIEDPAGSVAVRSILARRPDAATSLVGRASLALIDDLVALPRISPGSQ